MKLFKNFSFLLIGSIILYVVVLGLHTPSNNRNWWPELSRNSQIDFLDNNNVVVNNVRRATYNNGQAQDITYENRVFNLDNLKYLDFFVTPFGVKGVVHTILSFGFDDGKEIKYIALSVEARKEIGESYQLWSGMLNHYELMYIWADESDVIRTRVEDRDEVTYLYRLDNVDQKAIQSIFLQLANRTNTLAATPEFYHTIWNNCTIDLWQAVNRSIPHSLPWTLTAILPEESSQYLIDQGLLSPKQASLSLEERQVLIMDDKNTDIENYSTFICQQ